MTTSALRCAHCFDKVPDDAPIVGDDRLCAICARLAGEQDRRPRPVPPHLDQDVEAVAARVCREVGAPFAEPEEEIPPHPLLGGEGNVAQRLVSDVRRWSDGRWWQVRIPVLLFLAWVWMRHTGDVEYQSIFKGLNLGVHELGHFVFAPFGDLMAALGGSLLQCLVPLIGMAMFIQQRDWFAVSFAWGWLGTSYFELTPYVGDAVRMQLPLVTPGGGHPIHDWNYILGDLGWLRHTDALAGAHLFAAHLCMAICVATMSWVLLEMFQASAKRYAERDRT